MTLLQAGMTAPRFEMPDINGNRVALEDFAGAPLLLSFHRFAACPLCNLHSDQLNQYYPIWQEKRLNIISFYQSTAETIKRHIGSRIPPYTVIPDADKVVYTQYGIETSVIGSIIGTMPLHPLAIRAMAQGYMPTLNTQGGDRSIIPADFLLNPDLSIHTAHYGKTAAHHLSIRAIVDFLESVPQMASV